jgi:hypothetical protein
MSEHALGECVCVFVRSECDRAGDHDDNECDDDDCG